MGLYEKDISHVVAFIGDNYDVNSKVSGDTYIPLIECASNTFNLAVKKAQHVRLPRNTVQTIDIIN